MANTLTFYKGLAATIPILIAGQGGFTTDTYEVYVGDGTTNHRIDFPDAARTKLTGIATGADVTDFTNVSSALAAATGSVAFNSQALTGLLNPVNAQDAVTKFYADAIATGLDIKPSCLVATTAALPTVVAAGAGVGKTLTASAVGILTVDGVATVLSNRIVVQNQVTASDNGFYDVTTEGTSTVAFILTRTTDADSDAEVNSGMFTYIESGTVNYNKQIVLSTNDPITVDTTALTFTVFASPAGVTTFTALTDTPAAYVATDIVRVNAGATALEFVGFAATYLDATAGGTSGATSLAPNSNVMYNHGVAVTGVHGAGTNNLLNSGSTIDGGTW